MEIQGIINEKNGSNILAEVVFSDGVHHVLWSVKCNELIVLLTNQRAYCQAGILCYANILINRTTQARR